MSVVLDAYAVIAALVGERARAEVEPFLSSGVVCAPNLTEILDVCVRVHGNDEATVRERIGWLLTGGLQVAALDAALALAAGSLRAPSTIENDCVRSARGIVTHWPWPTNAGCLWPPPTRTSLRPPMQKR